MKNNLRTALASLAVAFMSAPSMLLAAGYQAPQSTNLPEGTLMNIVTGIMNWLLMLVGILGVIGFAIAGVLYLTSAGDEGRAGTAKNAMLYSIIGVIVALLGMVILKAAETMLKGGNDATF